MATKQPAKKVEEKDNEVKPQLIQEREAVVRAEPKKSFEERTTVAQPWLNKDGEQVNK